MTTDHTGPDTTVSAPEPLFLQSPLDKIGKLWCGDNFDDLAEYVHHFRAGGYPVAMVVESRCTECDGRAFRVDIDEEEATRRACLACGTIAFIGDSAEHWSGTDDDSCACPCGGEDFAVAVGYALFDDGEVRWVSVGLRCLKDNILGVYADAKIDYSPSRHLLPGVTTEVIVIYRRPLRPAGASPDPAGG